MGAPWERTQFVDEGAIPMSLDQLDKTLLALRGERIGRPLLGSLLVLGGKLESLQQLGEMVGLELAGAARIPRDADGYFFAVHYRG